MIIKGNDLYCFRETISGETTIHHSPSQQVAVWK